MKRKMSPAREVLILAFYLLGYAILPAQQPINLLLKTGSPTEIFYLCVSPDGKTLAAYSRSHPGGPVTLNLWDIAQGTRIRLFEDAEDVGRMAFSPDGQFLVAAMGNEKTDIGIWETQSGERIGWASGHTAAIVRVSFLPFGNRFVTASEDKTLATWDIAGCKLVSRTKFGGPISAFALSSDGARALLGVGDNSFVLWDMGLNRQIRKISEISMWGFSSCAISSDGSLLLIASLTKKIPGTLKLWDAKTGKLIKDFGVIKNHLRQVAFSADDKYIFGADYGKLRCWDLATFEEIPLKPIADSDSIFLTDQKKYVISVLPGAVQMLDMATRSQVDIPWKFPVRSTFALVSSNKKVLFAGNSDGSISTWDLTTGRRSQIFRYTGWNYLNAANIDGRPLVIAYASRRLILIDLLTGGMVKEFADCGSAIRYADFLHDGKSIVTSSEDRQLRLWDIASGKEIRKFSAEGINNRSPSECVVSPDDRYVYNNYGSQIVMWDLSTGKKVRDYSWDEGFNIHSLAVSMDGRYLAAGTSGWEKKILLLDATTLTKIKQYVGLGDSVQGISFSPDGTLLIAGLGNGITDIIEVSSGKLAGIFFGQSGVSSVAFMGSNNLALAAYEDAVVQIYDGDRMSTLSLFSQLANNAEEWIALGLDRYWNGSVHGGLLAYIVEGNEVIFLEQYDQGFRDEARIAQRFKELFP